MDINIDALVVFCLILPFLLMVVFAVIREQERGTGYGRKRLAATFPRSDELEEVLVYSITLPKGGDWEPENAHSFLKHMLSSFNHRLTFRILAERSRITWQILDLKRVAQPEALVRSIRIIYPEAEVDVSAYDPPDLTSTIWRFVDIYKLYNPPYVPIKLVDDAKKHDPLVPLVQAMADLEEGERIIYTVHVGSGPSKEEYKQLRKSLTSPTIRPLDVLFAPGAALAVSIVGATSTPKYEKDQQKVFEQKVEFGDLYHVYITTQVDMIAPFRLTRATDLAAILLNQFSSDINALEPIEYARRKGQPSAGSGHKG